VIVGFAEIDGPADLGVHAGTAEFLGIGRLSDGRFDQGRPRQIELAPLGH
jgi:hypothetical protein